ncbi:putative Protein Hook-like protein 3 [Hypsibius exemplaris]|uniref:Protein Hook-like protein 3 n=1 Tax=Hypsibius exemplaris TaxID=2072580 RepID=A0A1W0W987_HYPEX|nr:putative Protein Hook-like protein 3 [Hypsibius exemplaris]
MANGRFDMGNVEFEPVDCSDQLFAWFQSLPLFHSYASIHDLSDGEAFLEALQRIDDVEFSDLTSSENHGGETIFLQTLRDRMVEYIEEKQPDGQKHAGRKSMRDLQQRLQDDFEIGGLTATSRLLQLLLVCAVLSPGKEEYIKKMQSLDESVTVVIPIAIDQILAVENHEEPSTAQYAMNGNYDCDKCATLQSEISHLSEEKTRLKTANARLKSELETAVDIENEKSPANRKLVQLQKETATLKESLEKVAASRDELRTRCDELQDQLTSAIVETEQLTRKLAEIDKLRDEVIEWKQTASHLAKFETEVKVYKRKLDDIGDLRQQLKAVENRNTELMTRNLELEQENSQVKVLTSEGDALRVELEKREQEHKLSVKRLESVKQEMAEMKDQITSLEKINLKMETEQTTAHRGSEDLEDDIPVGLDLGSELLPPSVKEDMLRLRMENAELEAKLKTQIETQRAAEEEKTSALQRISEIQSRSDITKMGNLYPDQKEVIQPNGDSGCGDALLAQRDAQIQALENELQSMRRNYAQQQKLITAAWYRMSIKMEQQSSSSRISSLASENERPLSFLEEQRRAVNAPVSSGLRTSNSGASINHASSYRAPSGSFFR